MAVPYVAATAALWTAAISLPTVTSIPTSECCFSPTLFGRCGDGTPATPCCGYGPCQPGFPPCCGCDGGCRSSSLPFSCSTLLEPVRTECRLYFKHTKNPGELSYLLIDCDKFTIEDLLDNSSNDTEAPEGTSITVFVDLGEEERHVVTAVELQPPDRQYRVLHGKVDPQTNETIWGLESLKVYESGHGPVRLDSGRLPGRFYMVDAGPPSSLQETFSAKFFGCDAEEDEDENPGAAVIEAIHRRAALGGSFFMFVTVAAILGQLGWRCCGRRLYRQWRLGGLSSMRLRLQGGGTGQEHVELPLLPGGLASAAEPTMTTRESSVEYRLEPDLGQEGTHLQSPFG